MSSGARWVGAKYWLAIDNVIFSLQCFRFFNNSDTSFQSISIADISHPTARFIGPNWKRLYCKCELIEQTRAHKASASARVMPSNPRTIHKIYELPFVCHFYISIYSIRSELSTKTTIHPARTRASTFLCACNDRKNAEQKGFLQMTCTHFIKGETNGCEWASNAHCTFAIWWSEMWFWEQDEACAHTHKKHTPTNQN